MTYTQSGQFRIYHSSEAGSPRAHDDTTGAWYYEPVDWGEGDVFSPGYVTEAAALAAAERWEQQQAWEAERARDA
ncbi:MAG TPA: hypothetical protein VKV26_11360 [Dehalococcoidia bacterium]|nr:hypothetical protein [Dehalococcoidia bacterium]